MLIALEKDHELAAELHKALVDAGLTKKNRRRLEQSLWLKLQAVDLS